VPRPAFDGARAFRDLKALFALGPRQADSAGAAAARAYIAREVLAAGLRVEEEPFTAETPLGPRNLTNLYARLQALPAPPKGADRRTILLGTHVDTKHMEALPSFAGANDGASGVAVLLECARALATAPGPRPQVLFAFFDGEEAVGRSGPQDGLYGSRAFVRRLVEEDRAAEIVAAIVVDMVGDSDLRFTDDVRSTAWLADLLLESGRRAGLGDRFERGRPETIPVAIPDDHVPFLRAGIPAALLIDFDFGGPDPVRRMARNRRWHTSEDDLQSVAPDSLRAAGEVLLEAVPAIMGR
jgi:Zn-dependent M28 family amino/carboxypeptidase